MQLPEQLARTMRGGGGNKCAEENRISNRVSGLIRPLYSFMHAVVLWSH